MNTPQPPRLTPTQIEAIEARFALRVSSRLDEAAAGLPHDISERLRIARQHAVAAAQQARVGALARPAAQNVNVVLTAPGMVLAGVGGLAQGATAQSLDTSSGQRGHSRQVDHGRRLDEAPTGWGWRLASTLPFVALVAGLWGIGAWHKQEQVQAATEVDLALLTDELPPNAYADPGFEEFLRTSATTGEVSVSDAPTAP